jgi:hypothetical protein
VHELATTIFLVAAFGGLSILGVLILLTGLYSAQRTSSIIGYAAGAALLFSVQLGWIGFWHSHGIGFGGENVGGATVLQWGSVAALVLVGGFLAAKLPPALGQAVERAYWWRDGARISALIVVAYLAGVALLRWGYPPGGVATPPPPAAWFVIFAGLALAWGLWRYRAWAWYAAVVCAVYAVARLLWFAYPDLLESWSLLLPSTPLGIRLLLLGWLLAFLLFSNARRLCIVRRL